MNPNNKEKIAIVVCSNSGIDYFDPADDLEIIRMNITFGATTSYRDYTELKTEEFYDRIRKNPNETPKTNFGSNGTMLELFDKLYNKGYKKAIVITISSHMSNLYNNVVLLAKDEEVKLEVLPFDSKTVSYPQTYMTTIAYEMANNGSTSDDIIEELTRQRDNMALYVTVDTLKYLVANGRLSSVSGMLGSLMKIRPILIISKEGKVETIDKVRTTTKAIEYCINKYFEDTVNEGDDLVTFIVHGDDEEKRDRAITLINEKYPNRKVYHCCLTPVVGAHAGPGALGIGYIKAKK